MTSPKNPEMQKTHRQKYWLKNRQISTVVSLAEFRQIEARAKSFHLTPGQMVLAESRAYQANESVPSDEMVSRLDDIRMLLRNIANNVNQAVKLSNRFKQLVSQRQIFQTLQRLETETDSLIRKPWSSVQPNTNGRTDDCEIEIAKNQ